MSEAESRLFALLDSSGDNINAGITLLQEMCVRVPFVSAQLSGSRRLRLYAGLLLDNPPFDYEENRGALTEEEKENTPTKKNSSIASLREAFRGISGAPNEAELQEFITRFTRESCRDFDEKLAAIATTLATVIADADLPTSEENLRWLYKLLNALQKDFVVPGASHIYDASLIAIFRLLLQYHDPHLSLHFDRYLINIGEFILNWVRSLFVINNNYQQAIYIWDWILIVGDPTLTLYFAIAYLVSHRQRLLALKTSEAISQALSSLTFVLPVSKEESVDPGLQDGRRFPFVALTSGKSLAQNADIAYRNTPRAIQRIIDSMLFPGDCSLGKGPEALAQYYSSFTCLPLERSDFAESFAVKETVNEDSPSLSYVIVDCRARESFDFARLPGAIFVGESIGFDGEKMNRVVEQLRDTRGCHLCIFGTGRPILGEINLLKVLALHLAQSGFPYISIGGFRVLVPLIKAKTIVITRKSTEDIVWDHLDRPVETLKHGLETLVSQFDKEETHRRAEEIKNIAKDGILAAKSWGRNVIQRVSQQLSLGNTTPPGSHATSTDNAPKTNTTTTSTAVREEKEEKGEGIGFISGAGARNQVPGRAQMRTHQPAFSLGIDDDDEDDDFGLISAPVYTATVSTERDSKPIVKGTVITKISPNTTSAPATGVDSPSGVPPVTRDILTEMDEEFDRLFGDGGASSQQQPQGHEKQEKNN